MAGIVQEHSNLDYVRGVGGIVKPPNNRYVRATGFLLVFLAVIGGIILLLVDASQNMYVSYLVFVAVFLILAFVIKRIYDGKPRPEEYSETNHMVENTLKDSLSLIVLIILLIALLMLKMYG